MDTHVVDQHCGVFGPATTSTRSESVSKTADEKTDTVDGPDIAGVSDDDTPDK